MSFGKHNNKQKVTKKNYSSSYEFYLNSIPTLPHLTLVKGKICLIQLFQIIQFTISSLAKIGILQKLPITFINIHVCTAVCKKCNTMKKSSELNEICSKCQL